MGPDPTGAGPPVVLSGSGLAGAPAAPRMPTLTVPAWLRIPRALQRPLAGYLALATIVTGAFAVVAWATASQNVLVPRSYLAFPTWESGPLHFISRGLPIDQMAIDVGFSVVVIVMVLAYGVAVAAVRALTLRSIMVVVVALHAIVLLSPPLQLTDVFNYLGYARLGGLHHLSPYTHTMLDEVHDPIYRMSSWHHLRSPYGPLFTALSYPLAWLPLGVAYWIVKVTTMLSSLALIALVARCARQLGRDPRFAVLFLALNPIYVIYAMGGFHNDFFMLVPSLAAVSLILDRRDRSAGAVLMLAVSVKFTAILLLPFLLAATRQHGRWRRVLGGAALAAAPLAAISLALFGPHLPNLGDQSTLLTPFSLPNMFGLLLFLGGGTPALLKLASVLMVATVVWLAWRRRSDWISSAGWGTMALIASLAWLMPWYVIWAIPLAALGTSLRLRRATAVLSVYLVLTFIPVTGFLIYSNGWNPLNTSAGHASSRLQGTLEHLP